MTVLKVIKGDITEENVDAIVNAANEMLLGGAGVDGAIHRAAGPELLDECRGLGGCPTGEARITMGYRLPAKFVIHAVGPRWQGGGRSEAKHLRSCYLSALEAARERQARSLSFCAISTGVYGYPKKKAAEIALQTIQNFVAKYDDFFTEIRFVCFDDKTREIYESLLEQRAA